MSFPADALRHCLDLVRQLPERLTRWARDTHAPYDIRDDGTLAWCRRCDDEWPCTEWARLDAQLEDLT